MVASIEAARCSDVPATRVRHVVLAGLCLAAAIAYIDRNCIGVAEGVIGADLRLSEYEMGAAMSAFFVTYAVFQLPGGWLAHVWGSRRTLPLLSAVWSAATALAALPGGLPMLLAPRLTMGAAQAGLFPCATATIATWFPGTRPALASGALAAFMSVRGAVCAMPTGA